MSFLFSQNHLKQKHSELDRVFSTPTTPFIILGTQSTDCNMLSGYLENHPQIHIHAEQLLNIGDNVSPKKSKLHWESKSTIDCESFLQGAFIIDKLSRNAIGFKLFPDRRLWSENHVSRFNSLLEDPHIYKIIVIRENKLAACSSMLNDAISEMEENDEYKNLNLYFKPSEFHEFTNSYDVYHDWLKKRTNGTPIHYVTYEKLNNEQSTEHILNGIANFLNIEVQNSWKKRFIAQAENESFTAAQKVVNYQELKNAFKHHPNYEKLGF